MEEREKRLIARLHGKDLKDVRYAVREAAESGNRACISALIELLERSLGDYERRSLASAVIEALGKLGAREAEPVLFKALESKIYFIKGEAAEALGKVGPSDEALEEMKEVISEDVPKEVKKDAIRGLAEAGGRKAVRHLVDVAGSQQDWELKQGALEAVPEADGDEAAYPLMEFYRTEADGKIKTDVINALARIGSVGALDFLLDALADSSPEVRSCAALALGEIGKPEAEAPLRRLLGDPSEVVRKSAAKALGLVKFLPSDA